MTGYRVWILRVHMALGLALAAYCVIVGLTGSILVFRDEIKAWDYPDFHRSIAIPISTTPDQALSAVRAAWPDGRPLSLTWPNTDSPYWMSYVLLKAGGAREVFTDPSTGRIVGDRDPSAGWNGWLARFHTNLLLGTAGRKANGYGACSLILMSFTGSLLWLPRGGAPWRRNFRLTLSSGWRVAMWQLHHITGAFALPFILVLAVTGTYFMWSADYVKVVSAILPRTTEPRPQPVSGEILTIAALAERAYAALPGRPIQRLVVVDSPNQAVRVTMREGTPSEFHRVSTVFLHPVTGEVLSLVTLDGRSGGDSILSWFSALHFGVFGGWPVRILWFVLGLSLPILSISGCLMWWRRVIEPALRGERSNVT